MKSWQRKKFQIAYWLSLIVLAISLSWIGFVTAKQLMNAAMENDTDFSADKDRTIPSALGSLLVGTSAEVGDIVFLSNVRLQAGPKPELFVVSGASGTRILVSLETPKQSKLVPGNVDLRGTIRRLPGLEVLRKTWRLSKDQADFFGSEQFYIAADYIKDQHRNATDE